jgi:hypothetical protein
VLGDLSEAGDWESDIFDISLELAVFSRSRNQSEFRLCNWIVARFA